MAEPSAPPTSGSPGWRRHRWAFAAGVAGFAVMALFWVLIYTGRFKQANPDRLDDRAWVASTNRLCRPVRKAIDDLPNAGNATSARQRSATLDRASEKLATMVDQISQRLPRDKDGRRIVRLWLADYRTYLGDRRAYASKLLQRSDAQPLFTIRHGQSVQDAVTTFADTNNMGFCEAPPDV